MFARGLSTRDIEAAFRDASGASVLSRTAVSQVTERLWREYEAFAGRLSDLGFQCFLHDLPHGQLQQFSARIAVGHTLGQQLIKLLARPLRCRYSRGHGDASSCRRRQPATLGVLVPSKSASPSRYPASLGLRRGHTAVALACTKASMRPSFPATT